MYQFYFLSIFMNLLAGFALAHESLQERMSIGSIFNTEMFAKPGFQLTVGIITAVVGFFKFLSVTDGNVPVVGDLLPAVAGLIAGFTLILMYYQGRATVSTSTTETLNAIFVRNRTVFGVLAIIAAVLHFFFHSVLFL
ncbi:hypothetical protein [Salinispira pacifica]